MGHFPKSCLRQQLLATKTFTWKQKNIQYSENYKHQDVNQGHFRKLWQASTVAHRVLVPFYVKINRAFAMLWGNQSNCIFKKLHFSLSKFTFLPQPSKK